MCGPLCVRMTSAVGIEDPRFSLLPVYKKDTGGSRDTHGTRTGHTGAHGHTDHTDKPHNHPNPTTHPHDHATAQYKHLPVQYRCCTGTRYRCSRTFHRPRRRHSGRTQAGGSSCSDDGGGPARSSQRVPTSPTASVVACASPCHRRLRGHQQCIWHPTHRQTSARIHAPASTATRLATQPSTRAPSPAVLHALALGVTR